MVFELKNKLRVTADDIVTFTVIFSKYPEKALYTLLLLVKIFGFSKRNMKQNDFVYW